MVLIPKGVDKDLSFTKSYTLVSLLLVLLKVLERLIVDRLMGEIVRNMSEDQHGFTPGKWTVTVIGECMKWINKRNEPTIIGIFLDISGAFDNLRW